MPWLVQLRDSMNVGMCSSLAQSEVSPRRLMGGAHHLAKASKTLRRVRDGRTISRLPEVQNETSIAASLDWRNRSHPGDDCVDVVVGHLAEIDLARHR